MTPDLPFWTRLLIRIAVEAACVVGAAMLLERLIRPAFWRRALWQSTVICLLLLTASELSGFGRGLASFLFAHPRPEPKFAVWISPVESATLPPPSLLPSFAPAPNTVQATEVKPEIVRPIWWPGLLWLAGGLAVLGRVAAAQILFISLRRRRPVVTQTDLDDRVHAILQRLAFHRKIRLLQSPGLTGPIAFGILRPSVALPADFAAKFSRAEQDAMLAHELAHLASRDPLWYLLADASSAALWWHPQAWWARRRLHRASELAADEAAALFPEGPAALAECLVTLGRQMTQLPAASRMGVEGGGFRSNLAERVQRLLRLADTSPQRSYGWPARAAKLAAIITISAAAIGLSGCLQSRDAEKQPTLQANLSQSWATSPAATVWHSALPLQKPVPSSAPTPVKFQPALQADPAVVQPSQPASSLATNPIQTMPGRKVIQRKLREIKVNELPGSFEQALEQGLPLSEVLEILHKLSISNDVENIGINFMFNPRVGAPEAVAAADGTLASVAVPGAVNPETIIITINPPLENVTLADVLNAICQVAVQGDNAAGINYSVEDYAVWFFKKAEVTTAMETRTFHVDPNVFVQGLKRMLPQAVVDEVFSIPEQNGGLRPGASYPTVSGVGGGAATNIPVGIPYVIAPREVVQDNVLIFRYFTNAGVNISSNGAFAFFNSRSGDLLVRATKPDLEIVEKTLELLNKLPAEVQIDAKSQPAQHETVSLGLGTFRVEPNSCLQTLRHLFPKDADAQASTLLNRYFAGIGIDLTDSGSFTVINPRTGDILARATMRNLDSMAQAIELLNKTPPVDSVDRAKELVNTSRTTGSIFLDRPTERAALETRFETRTYHVDPNTLLQGLRGVFPQIFPRQAGANMAADGLPSLAGTNGASRYNSLLTQCFASLGMNFTNNGAFVFFNERIGDLLVRATVQDLGTVERALELLNKAPPQVQIDAKFAILRQHGTNGVFFIGGNFNVNADDIRLATGTAPSGTAPSFTGNSPFANPTGVFPGAVPAASNPSQIIAPLASNGSLTGSASRTVAPNAPIFHSPTPGTLTGIMTDPQFRVFIQPIEQRDGTDILSMPRITTLSGREARISVTDIVAKATNSPGSSAAAPGNATNAFDEGPVLDVIPTVNADGYSIHLVLNATLREFLGYDNPAQIVPRSDGVSTMQAGVPTNAPQPVPRYRNFSRAATVNVWDGQTVLLGGVMPEPDSSQPQSTNTQSESVMVFITATIIDPAGNRVHTDDQMPFAKVAPPPQEATRPQPQSTNAPK